MPPQNRRIVTLRDATTAGMANEAGSPTTRVPQQQQQQQPKLPPPSSGGASAAADYCQPIHSTDNPNLQKTAIPLHHIPTLSNAQRCAEMLQRIHREFAPIIQRRGYKVLSISELCCCGDGLDHVTGKDGRRRKKLRKQSNNVWGYNQTRFFRGKRSATSHTIHLRLRHPCNKNGLSSGRFFEWEDVAGTMAHEMAHCIHQNHSPAFYKLMEDILDEHATNQVPGGAGGFSSFGQPLGSTTASLMPTTIDSGQRLGSGSKKGNATGRSRLLDEAGGRKLGGGTTFTSPTSRRDVMARAAESRRRLMAQTRIRISRTREPCVVELLDDDDDDDITISETTAANDTHTKPTLSARAGPSAAKRISSHDGRTAGVNRSSSNNKKPKASFEKKKAATDDGLVVDLTTPSPKKKQERQQHTIEGGTRTTPLGGPTTARSWICPACTLQNRELVLVCEACLKHRY